MEAILYNISQVLGITIIHSLWEGLLIYFILRVVFMGAPSLSAEKKYNLAVAALLSIFICFCYTLYNEVHVYNWVNLKSFNSLSLLPYLGLSGNSPHFMPSRFTYNTIARYMPYISALYIAGLITNLLKFGWEWNKIRLIKQSFIPAEQMQQYINSLSKKLNVNKYILLKFSERIDVPCVIGYLKPVILLPVSIASYLSACEIEAILLHELSHIKRNDYLVNVLQQIITVMLFFNPFAQLINRVINRERENDCDDAVLQKTKKPLIYARALLKLEETRASKFQLAMSATGKKYYLLNRIERIMKTKKPVGNIRHVVITLLLLSASLSGIAWFNPKAASVNTNPYVSHKAISKLGTPNGLGNSLLIIKKDSNKNIGVIDTIKRHHKAKVTIVDKNGNKKEYYTDTDSSFIDSTNNFYFSPEWKSQMDAMRRQGEEMRKKFESAEWKNQMLAMRRQGEEMRKKFESPEWKSQMEAMKRQGEEMKRKFESPEWKSQMELMKKQGEEMKKKFESPEWRAQMEAMKKQGEEMKKKFESPEWKAQMDAMKKQGEEMRKKFESPEWKNQMEAMKRQGEEMKKKFESPEWKNQMELMKRQGEEMRKKFESPEWKKSMKNRKWILKDSTNGVGTYTPEMREKDERQDKPVKKDTSN